MTEATLANPGAADGIRAMPESRTTTFSIVIPTYNEAVDICGTLEAVFAQSLPPCDVIVVDGGSHDATVARVREHSQADGITLIEESTRRGVAAARNVGLSHAVGEVVVFLNADVMLQPDFLSRLAQLYTSDEVDFVSVQSRVENTHDVVGRYLDAVHSLRYPREFVGWTEGFSVRRSAALSALFPEEIPGAGGEDVEFCDRLRKLGYRRVVDYSICVEHRVPAQLGNFFAQCRGRGRAVPYIERRLKEMPLPIVTLRRGLVALKTLAVAAMLVPNAVTVLRIARRSRRGLHDAPMFWLLYHAHFAALRIGEIDSLLSMWLKRDPSR